MNKELREIKEMKSLFADPKYYRQAWKAVGNALLQAPATKTFCQVDKDGNPTLASEIDQYSYLQLKADIARLAKDQGAEEREPTQLEMIMMCQMIRARYDTSAATFVRDTLGAKPIDESKQELSMSNPFEQLSDEELELIAQHRQAKLQETDGKEVETNEGA